jgi:hypothetical protein
LFPGVFGLVIWRLERRQIAQALSWTIPLTIWSLTALFLVGGTLGLAMGLLGLLFLCAMIFTKSAPTLWVNRLARGPRTHK